MDKCVRKTIPTLRSEPIQNDSIKETEIQIAHHCTENRRNHYNAYSNISLKAYFITVMHSKIFEYQLS